MIEKLRVLHVVDILTNNSGVANVIMNYVRQSLKSKYVFDIVIYKESDKSLIEEVESFGGRVFLLPDIKVNTFLDFKRAFAKVLRQNHYEIVHGHLANSVFLYMNEAKRQNIPIRIIHSHSTLSSSGLLKRIRNGLLNMSIPFYCTHYFACSEQAGISLFKNYIDVNEVNILSNGIDPDKFMLNNAVRSEMRKFYQLDNYFVIGHVGRFSKEKNHTFIINTFKELIKINQNCRLVLIGDGALKRKIMEEIKEAQISDYVLVLGIKDNISDYYQMFDCFWLPSLFEGFGLVALEAQCSGLPCVVSNTVPKNVAITDLIQFISINDAKQWIEITQIFAKNSSDRADQSPLIKKSKYDIFNQGSELFALYDKFLKKD